MSHHQAIRSAAVMILTTLFLTAGSAMAQLGPMLRVTPSPLNFDTTLCGTTKCSILTFENVGNSPLRIDSIASISAPFSGTLSFPLQLQPGQRQTFPVCYSPSSAPRVDSQQVTVLANGRVPLSIGMVFDTSGSMGINDFMDVSSGATMTRIAAANQAGRQFMTRLVDTFGIQDEAAIFRYSSGVSPAFGFTQSTAFTTNRTLLVNNVPNAVGGGTCTYQALRQAIDQIRTRNVAGRRVLVLLSDGNDDGCGGLTQAALLQYALAPDVVRIFTIGIGGGISEPQHQSLQLLATSTGGRAFRAQNLQSLLAVYDSIGAMLSQNTQAQSFQIRGRAVAPQMVLSATSLEFDSVRVGDSRCLPVVISNTGDAPLVIAGLAGLDLPFSIEPLTIPAIAPGSQTTVNLCFTPTRLRVQNGAANFTYTSCSQTSQQVSLRGIGYDSVTVLLTGSFTAKPGSVIEVPVVLRGGIPASYDVREFQIAIGYNKTMLFPLDRAVETAGTLGAAMGLESHSTEFGPGEAITTYTLRDGTLTNPNGDSVLVRLGFLVLHGNALETPIRLVSAVLADGNPRVGLVGPGTLRADSICYQRERLIDASKRYGGVIGKISGTVSNPNRQVSYSITAPAQVTLRLFDALGRQLHTIVDDWREDGEYEALLDVSDLSSGTYVLRLDAGGFADVTTMIITK